MFAVFRETTYRPDLVLQESPQFQEFQRLHAGCRGYRGTIVTDVGEGRYLTATLWETSDDMHAARDALGAVVGRLLDPMMTKPSTLLGTGRVVVGDLVPSDGDQDEASFNSL
jgi:hypothetical protein